MPNSGAHSAMPDGSSHSALNAGGILPLRLEEVTFRAGGRDLLRGITWTLDTGGPTCILGPNGAGKTLLLLACHGLIELTSGSVRWGSLPQSAAAKRQAMVFQRPVLLRRSVIGNVEHALRLRGVCKADAMHRAAAALNRVGLGDLATRPARVLSGGEQQRVALARAWALEPEVLLLDEPTANLDPHAIHEIERTIAAMHTAGVAILMTTHDLGQARRLAKRIVFLHDGRILEDTSADTFFAGPMTPQAAAFLRGDLIG
jgi:tungstate transport system ATP-binding protein